MTIVQSLHEQDSTTRMPGHFTSLNGNPNARRSQNTNTTNEKRHKLFGENYLDDFDLRNDSVDNDDDEYNGGEISKEDKKKNLFIQYQY